MASAAPASLSPTMGSVKPPSVPSRRSSRPFEEEVDTIDTEQQLVEQAQVRRIEVEDAGRDVRREARRELAVRVPQGARRLDIAGEDRLGREVHGQRHVEFTADVHAQLVEQARVQLRHAVRTEELALEAGGKHRVAVGRVQRAVDARLAVLDEHAQRPDCRLEVEVGGGQVQRGRDARGVEDVDLGRVCDVEPEVEVERQRAFGQQVGVAAQFQRADVQVEVDRQGLAGNPSRGACRS